MGTHQMSRPHSGFAVLCLLCGLVGAAPASTTAADLCNAIPQATGGEKKMLLRWCSPCSDIPRLQKRAQAGNVEAQADLGWCSVLSEDESGDKGRRGVERLRKAAEQGNAKAQARLGAVLAWIGPQVLGLPEDQRRGAEWLRKAAEQGNGDAMICLGQMYEAGAGVPENKEKGWELIHRGEALIKQGLPFDGLCPFAGYNSRPN